MTLSKTWPAILRGDDPTLTTVVSLEGRAELTARIAALEQENERLKNVLISISTNGKATRYGLKRIAKDAYYQTEYDETPD